MQQSIGKLLNTLTDLFDKCRYVHDQLSLKYIEQYFTYASLRNKLINLQPVELK
jgi:hypothetical protein